MTKKIRHVNSSVATVIPEIGFEDDPISPVSREETVTNRKPNATISTAPIKLKRRFNCGNNMINASRTMMPPMTTFIDMS